MAWPKTRPESPPGQRYCGTHREHHPLGEFSGREPICRRAKYEHHIRRKYDLGLAEYEAMVGDGLCPICRHRPHRYVDHDHSTGRVRGLLCQPCNTALGAFLEDPAVFERALAYLAPAVACVS